MKYCDKCGKELLDEAVMCPKCGNSFSKKETTPEQKERSKAAVKGAIMIIVAIAILFVTIVFGVLPHL